MSEQIHTPEISHPINTSPALEIGDIIDDRFAILPKPSYLITQQERVTRKYNAPMAVTGNSHVYLAQDIASQMDVAVKLHHNSDELSLARHNREKVMAKKLVHSNIIPMVATGVHIFEDGSESPYIAFRYADRGDLRREKVDSPWQARRVVKYLGEAALALEYLHSQGIVHRDIKPANIVHDANHAYVGDLGSAEAIHLQNETTPVIHTPVADEVSNFEHTRDKILVGTLSYMSPQRASGKPATPADDVFSWGASAFQELANRSAFDHKGNNTLGMLPYFGAGEPVGDEHLPDFIPDKIVELVYAALEKKSENRPRVDELASVIRLAA